MKHCFSLINHTHNRTLPSIRWVSQSRSHQSRTLARTFILKYKKSKAIKSAYIHNPTATLSHNYLANTVTLRHTLSLSHATPTASGNHSHRLSLAQHPPPTTPAGVRRPLLTPITKSPGLGPRGFPRTHHRARGHRPHTSTPLSGTAGASWGGGPPPVAELRTNPGPLGAGQHFPEAPAAHPGGTGLPVCE